jgi:ribosomal protein S18 acetylase RimI-like enzyme
MKIRSMLDTDVNFVLSTWLKSYYEELRRNGSKGVIYPKDDVFFQGHQNKIKDLLTKAKCEVCTAPDDDNQIIGYVVYDLDSVHYIYVKQVFRKMGVAKALISRAFTARLYSHHTRFTKFINKGLQYDPYKF